MCVCVCVRACTCVCVCVHTHTHTHIHMPVYRLYITYRCYQITLQWNIFTQIWSGAKCWLDIYQWGPGLAVTGPIRDIGQNVTNPVINRRTKNPKKNQISSCRLFLTTTERLALNLSAHTPFLLFCECDIQYRLTNTRTMQWQAHSHRSENFEVKNNYCYKLKHRISFILRCKFSHFKISFIKVRLTTEGV